ncbi:hypothetical protein L7F22_002057 [Adiantum nelumboides]|nr:hypothetical protein [Adiantum nelumboides]
MVEMMGLGGGEAPHTSCEARDPRGCSRCSGKSQSENYYGNFLETFCGQRCIVAQDLLWTEVHCRTRRSMLQGTFEIDPWSMIKSDLDDKLKDRETRREFLSMEIPYNISYVFDHHAFEKANSFLKECIQESMLPVIGATRIVSDLSILSEKNSNLCQRLLVDYDRFFPELVDEDVIPSLHAYLDSCFSDVESIAFVTGNEKMLNLIADEPHREDLYYIARLYGIWPPRWYFYIDNEGWLQRASLKWDNPRRQSHENFRAAILQLYHVVDPGDGSASSFS